MAISTINTNSLAAAGVTQSKLATPVAGTGPAFSAYLSGSNQSITAGVETLVALNAKAFDTASCFNATGSTVGGIPAYSFLPNVAGYYQVNANIFHNGTVYSALIKTTVYKNGSAYKYAQSVFNAALGDGTATVSCLVYLNGTSDYINLYGYNTQTGPYFTAGSPITYLEASLVRGA